MSFQRYLQGKCLNSYYESWGAFGSKSSIQLNKRLSSGVGVLGRLYGSPFFFEDLRVKALAVEFHAAPSLQERSGPCPPGFASPVCG